MEVTQVVQNLAHEVPLVARKKTVVRCYLSVPDGAARTKCRGVLQLTLADGTLLQTPSMNIVEARVLPTKGVAPLREDLEKSLNFLLPDAACVPGVLQIDLISLIANEQNPFPPAPSANASLKVTFVETPPLRVKLFSIRHTSGFPKRTYLPTQRDLDLTLSWLRRAYPTPEVISSHLVIDAPQPWPFECGDINLQLAAIRRQDMAAGADPRTHYFGMVADGGGSFFMRGCASDIPTVPSPDIVASGPTGSGTYGWDNDGSYGDWYTGHELGHTFGRSHPGFCDKNSSDDPAFPFPDGKLSGTDRQFVGFDIGDATHGIPMAALPGVKWADVMTYCQYQWICSYTLAAIHERLTAENLQFPAPLAHFNFAMDAVTAAKPESVLTHVLAMINLESGVGRIVSVQPVERGVPSRPTPDSPAILETLDAQGNVLLSRPLRIKKSTCCEGETCHGMIDALLPTPPEVQQIRLLYKGAVVDTFRVATPTPTPSLLTSQPNILSFATNSIATAAAAAEVAPAEREKLFYTVQISRDGGTTWETIGSALKTPDISLNKSDYPVATKILIRTRATNGFKVTETIREEAL